MKLISPLASLNVHFIYIIKQLLSESVSEFTISSSIPDIEIIFVLKSMNSRYLSFMKFRQKLN